MLVQILFNPSYIFQKKKNLFNLKSNRRAESTGPQVLLVRASEQCTHFTKQRAELQHRVEPNPCIWKANGYHLSHDLQALGISLLARNEM